MWLRHADQIRQSNFMASHDEEDDNNTESEGQAGQSGQEGKGLTNQRQGEEKQKELQPDTTHTSVQPQLSARPAHTEAETNVGNTPVSVSTVTVTSEPQLPRSASRTTANIPKSSEVVTTRNG